MNQQDVFDIVVKHSIYVQRFGGGLSSRVLKALSELDGKTSKTLKAMYYDAVRTRNAQPLLSALKDLFDVEFNTALNIYLDELQVLAETEVEFNSKVLSAKVAANLSMPSAAAIAAAPQLGSKTAKELFETMRTAHWRSVRSTIIQGIEDDLTTDEIVRKVVGRQSKRGVSGLAGKYRKDIKTTVLTAANAISNEARMSLYRANTDVVDRVRYVAVLDGRTTAVCRSRDGKEYDLVNAPKLPAHYRCRSTLIPMFAQDRQLDGKRASIDGPVDANTTYESWLRRQDKDFIYDVLGRTKGDLFINRKLRLDQFIDNSGKEYTINQLRQIYNL
ncbi:minor capsid protein [Idiomarina piscisalsi]|uniref:Phage head morphogenesis domain-containing protein n=1 Tax=Idiomarina piscisalsi TaxID=1096243 RepID=A0A432YXE6_9GAMM|nr:minor capsid protein [Idiomarina piscisalsi]RUO67999.1 hypothetical protein CWI73_03845 [Idiomarina piscisalsi]